MVFGRQPDEYNQFMGEASSPRGKGGFVQLITEKRVDFWSRKRNWPRRGAKLFIRTEIGCEKGGGVGGKNELEKRLLLGKGGGSDLMLDDKLKRGEEGGIPLRANKREEMAILGSLAEEKKGKKERRRDSFIAFERVVPRRLRGKGGGRKKSFSCQ